MIVKIKKKKKAVRLRGTNSHGWGFRKKHKGSGHRGGKGMAGTGKRADHKKSLVIKKYGNKYFGRQGVTSKGTRRKKEKIMNLRNIEEKFAGKNEIDLSEYKILGVGEITRVISVSVKAITKAAREKIEKAGGKIIIKGKIDKVSKGEK